MQKEYKKEFREGLERQIAHLTIKTDYIAFKVSEMEKDKNETKEEIAKVKVDLNAHKKQLK